jgi:peptidoglycan-associated lipoprotein
VAQGKNTIPHGALTTTKGNVMKKIMLSFLLFTAIFLTVGCERSSGSIWEDTKTIGRYIHRKGRLLWNQDVDSRMVANEQEFTGPQEEEYIPLKNEDLKLQYADLSIPQPKEVPGAEGSQIPGIDHFQSPSSSQAKVFKTLYFNTDEHILRLNEYFQIVTSIAKYMKKNPNLYIFVAGHCDERASEAYNLALGTRRANTIRGLLIKQGVEPSHVYTISYGKEMPADSGHSKEAWAKNRRVEFKIYEKK